MLQKTYLVVSENSGSRLYRMQGDMASTRYHVQRSYASRGDVREDAYACTCNCSSRILNKVREIHVVFSCLPLFRESPKCVSAMLPCSVIVVSPWRATITTTATTKSILTCVMCARGEPKTFFLYKNKFWWCNWLAVESFHKNSVLLRKTFAMAIH